MHHAGRAGQQSGADRDVNLVLGFAPVHRGPADREGDNRRIHLDAAEHRARDALDVRLPVGRPIRESGAERLEPGAMASNWRLRACWFMIVAGFVVVDLVQRSL